MALNFSKDKSIRIRNLLNKKKYPVDEDYQRESGAWTKEDEQYFIDSVLKGIRIPKIYLHKKRYKFYIIDGQQRIDTIRRFVNGGEGSFCLKSSITGREEDITFNELKESEKKRFLEFRITASIVIKSKDDEIRELFRRLQRGKPLTEGEKLNAMAGSIVKLMRKITKHPFFKNSLKSEDKRHKFYHIASVFMYLEDRIDDTTFSNIQKFFERDQLMRKDDKVYKNCCKNLNLLSKCYKENEIYSSRLGWLTSVYLFASDIKKYGLLGLCPESLFFHKKY